MMEVNIREDKAGTFGYFCPQCLAGIMNADLLTKGNADLAAKDGSKVKGKFKCHCEATLTVKEVIPYLDEAESDFGTL